MLRLRDFLIELGVGSAFVGSQNRLEVDGRNGCARLVVLPYSISHGSPISILGSSLCAMYGEAVLRASFHAGWPTLGGVPGRLTLDSANALDLASHESSAENLPAVQF